MENRVQVAEVRPTRRTERSCQPFLALCIEIWEKQTPKDAFSLSLWHSDLLVVSSFSLLQVAHEEPVRI